MESRRFCVSAKAGRSPARDRCSSGLRVEPILVRLLARVGFCSVPEEAVSIFDSLVANLPPTQGHGSQAFMGRFEMGKPSQQTLNCALSVDLL